MSYSKKHWFLKGFSDGTSIAFGYLAVSFSLGIAAKNAGFNAFTATLTSFSLNASAGEYAGFTLISAGCSILEVVLMVMIANARYFLMSCSLSQKIDKNASLLHRGIIGFFLTDEIFGASIRVSGLLSPYYTFGLIACSIPCWSLGTFLGVICGNILPPILVHALSFGLYGMFLAIIVPPARKNKVIGFLIILSMSCSFLFSKLRYFSHISEGIRVIILTVTISGIAAFVFPIKDTTTEESSL